MSSGLAEVRFPGWARDFVGTVHTQHKLDREACPKCGMLVTVGADRMARHQGSRQCSTNAGQSIGKPSSYRAQLDKKDMLATLVTLYQERQLSQPGRMRLKANPKSVAREMAARMNMHPTTFSRHLKRTPRAMIRVTRRPGRPNVYAYAFGEGKAKLDAKSYCPPTSKELSQTPSVSAYFPKPAKGKYNETLYHWIPGWILHSKLPGGMMARLVLVVLAAFGLFKIHEVDPKTGKKRQVEGEIEVSYEAIARFIGCSVSTVRRYLRYWGEWSSRNDAGELVMHAQTGPIKLLRIVEQPGIYVKNGKELKAWEAGAAWQQPPNKIIYLAGQEFDEDLARHESEQFTRRGSETGVDKTAWWDEARQAHQATLSEWQGTRQWRSTFHAEVRRRLLDRNMPRTLLDRIIPPPPRPPDRR